MFKTWLIKRYVEPVSSEYRTSEHIAAAKAGGEDKMGAWGWYNSLRTASPHIMHDSLLKAMPAHEVFAFIAYNKVSNQISYKIDLAFQKMAKQKK